MKKINALMVGTGEYTTGFVHGAAADSDKSAGVVALTLFDLRQRGLLNSLKMVGTNGSKFPSIRQHLARVIGDAYNNLSTDFESFPGEGVADDPKAYQRALATMSRGDVVIVFTPDDTHFQIAMDAVAAGCHVLIAKPIVKTVHEHQTLAAAAKRANVLVAMEVHKRWDPIYSDARDRVRQLGEFSFFSSYMSQPKSQLQTFRSWAGKSSDISYYLNAHHIDFHVWSVGACAQPLRVYASASTGVAQEAGLATEDTITLTVDWRLLSTGHRATAVYTSSWIAPSSDVHSQQRFFFATHQGEVTVDQAHRGYALATDSDGYSSPNPLFMKYAPNSNGEFVGQQGYGYRSIEAFVQAAVSVVNQRAAVDSFRDQLATVHDTLAVTAILEAGRRSLDNQGQLIHVDHDADGNLSGLH